jgi:hypothetical protein
MSRSRVSQGSRNTLDGLKRFSTIYDDVNYNLLSRAWHRLSRPEPKEDHKHKTRIAQINVDYHRKSIVRIDWIPCRVLLALISDPPLFPPASIAQIFDAR